MLTSISSPGDLNIGLYTNSGSTNKFRVTIDLSSRYSNNGDIVTATSCNLNGYSKASNLVTSSTSISFDLDTSIVSSNQVKLNCDGK